MNLLDSMILTVFQSFYFLIRLNTQDLITLEHINLATGDLFSPDGKNFVTYKHNFYILPVLSEIFNELSSEEMMLSLRVLSKPTFSEKDKIDLYQEPREIQSTYFSLPLEVKEILNKKIMSPTGSLSKDEKSARMRDDTSFPDTVNDKQQSSRKKRKK